MGRKKTRFTQEFKQEAIKLVQEQGYTQAEVGRRLGVNAKNLSRWIQESMSCSPFLDRTRPKLREDLLGFTSEYYYKMSCFV